jgi:TM2 domain-containing membrane protein YozV
MNKMEYLQTFKSIRDSVPPDRRDNFDLQFGAREKDPAIALILSLTFGYFGVDRFYLGNIILGVLKLITFGGFFIWAMVDWFLITDSTRKANASIAKEVRQMIG